MRATRNSAEALRDELAALALPAGPELVADDARDGSAFRAAAVLRTYRYPDTPDFSARLGAALDAAGWVAVGAADDDRTVSPLPGQGSIRVRPVGSRGDGVMLAWGGGRVDIRHEAGWLR